MFDKLEDLLIHFEEIMSELAEPNVANNQERFRMLMKEQSDLQPIVDAYKEYNTAYIRIEVKFSCLERYIAGKNIIKDNILHEVVSVIFLVIVLLDA